MILSAAHIDHGAPLRAEICIVGAGAAGITLACELDECGARVLLIDAGPCEPGARVEQDRYEGSSEAPHPPAAHFRRLGFGGTTAIWGGRCVPYDPIDFEARDYVADSGWPLAYDDVARHYPAAMRYCDAGEFSFDPGSAFEDKRQTLPGLIGGSASTLVDSIERYSLPTDFGHRYRGRLNASRNVQVLGGAHVLRLVRDEHADRIAAVECRIRKEGAPLRVEARQFVLATGGIETPRLLLVSNMNGVALGNRFDCVGRFYSCHIENCFGVLRARSPGVVFGFETTRDGVYARRKLHIDPETQRRERLLNIAFRLHYPDVSNAAHRSAVLSAVYLGRRTVIPEYRRILQHSQMNGGSGSEIGAHLGNLARDIPGLARFGLDWLRKRVLATRKLPYVLVPNADGSFPVEFNSEQTPLWDSRVRLGQERDRFGMPRVHLQWRMCENDVDSICRAYLILRDRIGASATCDLEIDDTAMRDKIAASVPVGGHHIGTTRMSDNPRKGVVNKDCAVFDFPNLFISSAAVFPTSGHANPTLTIVAMAIRLAHHLRAELASAEIAA